MFSACPTEIDLVRLDWNEAFRIRSLLPNVFVSDVKLVNSAQPTETDDSSTDFDGGTVQLGSRAGGPPRGQRVLLTQETV